MLFSCKMNDKEEKARDLSFTLLEKIEKGTALGEFPEKRFPPGQGRKLLNALKNECDFKNRKKLFIGEYYQKNLTGPDHIAFIHEYRLKCEDLRLIIVYALEEEPELFGFRVDPVSKSDPMVEAVKRGVKK